jgi:hypothetical protein
VSRAGRVALLLALVVALVACSSDDGGGADDAGTDTTAAVTDETTDTTAVDIAAEWTEHEAPAECECAHGDPYTYWTRTADPEKVVLFFQGGGACFSADGCAEGSDQYTQVASGDEVTGNAESEPSGIFDLNNPDNPFRDYSFVYVPYCTGDLHLGDAVHDYGDGVEINHKGYVNARAAYDTLLEEFGDADEVFVTGSSAGGVPAPLFGGLLADDLPDAEVSVLADASGAYPSDPVINEAIGSLWGAFDNVPDWPENEGLTAADYGVPDLFIQSGLHDPDLRLARYDTAYDEVQADFSQLAGFGGDDLKVTITDNEAYIEDGGVDVASFLAPGEVHTILGRPELYTLEVDGVRLLDWLTEYAAGEDVPDVACTGDCERPAPGADTDTEDDTTTTTTG